MNSPQPTRKRIAFVLQPWDIIYDDRENTSSLPILTQQLARRLAAENEVIIYGRKGDAQQARTIDANNINYRRVHSGDQYGWLNYPYRIARKLKLLQNPKRPFFASGQYYRSYFAHVAADLAQSKPDIVHIHNFSQFAPEVKRASPGSQVVLHMHCEWLTQLDGTMIQERLEAVDMIFNCGDFITVNTAEKFPAIAQSIHTLNNGVNIFDFAQMDPGDDREADDAHAIKFLYVGRISPEKGVHILVDAFKSILKQHPNARLDIIGPPGTASYDFIAGLSDDPKVIALAEFFGGRRYFDFINQKIQEINGDQVRIWGKQDHAQVMEAMRRCDIFIFPAVWNEPFGMPVVEANMNRAAVIASRCGGIVDIIRDGETGILVEPGDVGALTQAMEKLILDESYREKISQAGYERAKQTFNWDKISAQLAGYYHSILDDGGS